MNKGNTVDIICFHFNKAFGKVPCDILSDKLLKLLGDHYTKMNPSCLTNWIQKVNSNGCALSWGAVAGGILQGSLYSQYYLTFLLMTWIMTLLFIQFICIWHKIGSISNLTWRDYHTELRGTGCVSSGRNVNITFREANIGLTQKRIVFQNLETLHWKRSWVW